MATVNEEFKVPTWTPRRRLKLLNNSLQSDVYILAETDETFFAHSNVLKERCPHFLDIMRKRYHTEEDMETSRIQFRTDISSETLFALLKFLYIDRLDVSIYLAPELLRTAEILQLSALRRKCAEFIQNNVDLHNVCELFILAHEHKCNGLKQACLSIIAKNFSMISKMSGYLKITQNPILLLELAQVLSVTKSSASNAGFSHHRHPIPSSNGSNNSTANNHNNTSSNNHSSSIQIGKRITISDGVSGIIKFIGRTNFDGGKNQWIGIETDLPIGTHDGSVSGVRYFEAEQNHGIFVGMWFV